MLWFFPSKAIKHCRVFDLEMPLNHKATETSARRLQISSVLLNPDHIAFENDLCIFQNILYLRRCWVELNDPTLIPPIKPVG